MQPKTYQYWLIIYYKYTTLICDVSNWGNGQGGEGDGV